MAKYLVTAVVFIPDNHVDVTFDDEDSNLHSAIDIVLAKRFGPDNLSLEVPHIIEAYRAQRVE
jgi:hypothetical protein